MTTRKPHCNVAVSIEHLPHPRRLECVNWCFEIFGKDNVDPWPSNVIDIKRTNGNNCIYLTEEAAAWFRLKWNR
jgi:hypothetical protein